MLNLYKNLTKLENYNSINNGSKSITIKNYPSSTREWKNSIYVFNKNNLNLIPETSKLVLKTIKSYFYLYNDNLENKLRKSNIRMRFRKLSSNRIYVSNGSFKHTSNKVIITLYIYNRQKVNYTYLIQKKFSIFFTKKLSNNLFTLKHKINNFMRITEINKKIVFKVLQKENNSILLYKFKSLYLKYYNYNIYYSLLSKIYTKYKKYYLYKQLLYINKSKFNYNYLSFLNSLLKIIYNKDVQFDIVNLKYFYLSSDIFLQSVLLKIKRNRRRLMRTLNLLMNKSKINKISKFITYNPTIKKPLTYNKDNDPINYLILQNSKKNKKTLRETALSLIKYKRITGVRLEAKGRLTRRYTASRSASKLKYKGNLINIDSSYLGLSSIFLRGNLRSNLQYTKLKSKTRIGSFGLKGWVSGY